MTDANTLNSLPLSGAQPTWWDVLLAAPQSKMTHHDIIARWNLMSAFGTTVQF
jgi:hypothetical protein